MEGSYISWNLPNWITVVLMVSMGYLLAGVVLAGIARAQG